MNKPHFISLILMTLMILISSKAFAQKKILYYGNLSMEKGLYAEAIYNYDVIINNNKSESQYKEAFRKKAMALYLDISYAKAMKQWASYVNQFGYDLTDNELYRYAHVVVQYGQYEMAREILDQVADTQMREAWTYNLVDWPLAQPNLNIEENEISATNINGFRKGVGLAIKDGLVLLARNEATKERSVESNYGTYAMAIYRPKSPTELEADPRALSTMNLDKIFYANPSISENYLLFGSSNGLAQAGRNTKTRLKKENTLQLYMVPLDSSSSEKAIHLGIGNEAYDYSFPFLYQDSLLFFATNQPGGMGGFDIMYTRGSKEGWAEPRSLEGVNTTDHDTYPMVSNGKFYFTSKGRPGYGGSDIYEGDLVIEGDKVEVTNINNMGAPINTNNDEFGLVLNGDSTGYFMTNRFDMSMDHVVWLDSRYQLKDIIAEIDLDDSSIGILHVADSTVSFAERNVYFGFDLSALSTDAKKELDDIIVIVLRNPELKVKLEGYTDAIGTDEYNLKLSARRNQAVKDYLLENNVSESDINSQAFGESKLEGCDGGPESCTEAEHARNRQVKVTLESSLDTEIRSYASYGKPFLEEYLFFDFDAGSLTQSVKNELDKVAAIIKENPELSLRLEGHTDAYGTESHNLELSEQRNLAVLAYLQSHNISIARIDTEAFGKSMLVNNCSVPESCSERENALNRFVRISLIENY